MAVDEMFHGKHADEAEVHVQGRVADLHEEMLAPRLRPLEDPAVQPVGVGSEAALRARRLDLVATERALEAVRQGMDGVTLGHAPSSPCCIPRDGDSQPNVLSASVPSDAGTPIRPRMRRRSSIEANSTVILPLR